MNADKIDGYRLGRTLGSGYSAKVKLAFDADGNQFALKIFDLTKPDISKDVVRFIKQEVEATKSLSH